MPAKPVPDHLLQQVVDTVHVLRGNITQAAVALGFARQTVQSQLLMAKRRGIVPPEGMPQMPEEVAPPPTPEHEVKLRRMADDANVATAKIRDLQRIVADIEDIRTGLFGLKAEPLAPKPIRPMATGTDEMTWLIGVFDTHLGKRFDRADVNGLMDYNVAIACDRIRRQFQISARLMRDHGGPVARIVVVLGGDNANGALRDDDLRENEIPPMQQARVFAENVVAGVDHLLNVFPDAEVEVHSLPGNHGRTTRLPPSVQIAENYDTLAGWFVEAHYAGEPRVRVVSAEHSPDVILDIYGRGVLATHGDRIGSNGGDGQIGALGPTKRGSLKIEAQLAALRAYSEGHPPHGLTVMGHFHTYWTDLRVLVSGANIGVDPWSLMKLRTFPRPPILPLLGFHPRKWLVENRVVFTGHKDEGPLCADPTGSSPDIVRAARDAGV